MTGGGLLGELIMLYFCIWLALHDCIYFEDRSNCSVWRTFLSDVIVQCNVYLNKIYNRYDHRIYDSILN